MERKIPYTYRDYIFSLTIVIASSLLVSIWVSFSGAPTIVKFIYSLSVWFMLILFPWSWIKSNYFSKLSRFLLNSMLFWGAFEILRSAIAPSPEVYKIGNRFTTLFFNEYCALIFIPPLFAYTVDKYNVLHDLLRYSEYYVFGGLIVSLLSLNLGVVSILSVYFISFWMYIKKYCKRIILIVYVIALINAILGARLFYIFTLFAIAAYVLCYKYNMRRLQKVTCIVSIIFPVISFFPLLSINAQEEESGFKKILEYVGSEFNDNEMSTDTRTFLYLEMAVDLRKNDALIIGKGANSRYYSNYFSGVSNGDSSNRLISEVPILLFLLRGGLVYCLLYLSFILLCVYNAVWKGKSRFVNCIGIMLAGWFVNLFVGDVTGCSFYHLVVYSLCGMCLSRKWLNKSDIEIKKLINTRSLIRI